MNNYISIVCFALGLVIGSGLTVLGFWLGFKASYAIRAGKGQIEEGNKGLFGAAEKDPAEFELLNEDK